MFLLSLRKPAFVLAFLLVSFSIATAQDKDWKPISSGELAQAKPIVEPDADAEAIFWEVRIDDSASDELSLKHYVRVKIFTERGREKFSKLDVPFTKGMKVKDLSGRVIRPDGTIVEIKKDDIFEREIIKANGIKIKAKSFAVPNIEPGVIIEYRYKEVYEYAQAKGMTLVFQRDVPVQKIAYYYKPWNKRDPDYQSYNFSDTKFVKDKDGYWLATRTDVPAMKEEPRMPPDDQVRAWMLLTGVGISVVDDNAFTTTYSVKIPGIPSLYWGAVSQDYTPLVKLITKSSGDIKKLAESITAGASTPAEKLKKIYEYCQANIANTTFDASITDDKRAKLPVNKSFGDVLKRKSANSQWIDMLFGALASASGLETRLAVSGDRSQIFFDPKMTNERLIHPAAIAVKVDNDWKFFNPGVPFLPYGMLTWYEEGTPAMVVGEKEYAWVNTPMTTPDVSVTKRTGKFNLIEDGTLEGDVSLELNGQPGLDYRMENYDEAMAKLEQNLTDEIKKQISSAEISNVSIENLTDNTKPLVQKYKIRVPNYAQKTGKRLFVQPNFFKYGSAATFSSSTRKYDIFFRYPWSEADNVEITWPAAYELDNADSPAVVADPQKIGSLDIHMRVDKAANLLKYDRKFYFGGGGNVLFGHNVYPALKNLFDMFDKADSHTITLKGKM